MPVLTKLSNHKQHRRQEKTYSRNDQCGISLLHQSLSDISDDTGRYRGNQNKHYKFPVIILYNPAVTQCTVLSLILDKTL